MVRSAKATIGLKSTFESFSNGSLVMSFLGGGHNDFVHLGYQFTLFYIISLPTGKLYRLYYFWVYACDTRYYFWYKLSSYKQTLSPICNVAYCDFHTLVPPFYRFKGTPSAEVNTTSINFTKLDVFIPHPPSSQPPLSPPQPVTPLSVPQSIPPPIDPSSTQPSRSIPPIMPSLPSNSHTFDFFSFSTPHDKGTSNRPSFDPLE